LIDIIFIGKFPCFLYHDCTFEMHVWINFVWKFRLSV